MSGFTVILDLDRCQGYANCVIAAPDIFDIDDETGTATLLQMQPDASLRSAAEEAARQCPAEAIALEADQPTNGSGTIA